MPRWPRAPTTCSPTCGYLRQLPVNEVKIDKVFVLGLSAQHTTSAAKDRLIVRAVTGCWPTRLVWRW